MSFTGGDHGVVPAECTGHAATLGDGDDLSGEHVEYVAKVAEATDLRTIAGDRRKRTAQTITLAREIESTADIDAHVIISPYQDCPPRDPIVDHYDRIAAAMGTTIPVVTGFLGLGPDGDVRTLWRGGSDTTATVFGDTLEADRVVIVTDVEGVLIGSQDIVDSTRYIEENIAGDLGVLFIRGAEVVAPEAITHKPPGIDVEIVHYRRGDFLKHGTHVEGDIERLVSGSTDPVCCLTIAGRRLRRVQEILAEVAGCPDTGDITVVAVSSGVGSFTRYLDADDGRHAKRLVHESIVEDGHLTCVSLHDRLAAIRVVIGAGSRSSWGDQ